MKKDYQDAVRNFDDVPGVMGKVKGMGMPDDPGTGISCQAINCDNNKDKKCQTQPEISAGGACMTYSKSNYKGGEKDGMQETETEGQVDKNPNPIMGGKE